jgi:hypothetical protein
MSSARPWSSTMTPATLTECGRSIGTYLILSGG